MTISAWRIFKPKHRDTTCTGDGARLFGGRWNSRGTSVVYTAQTVSLASLELLVHLDNHQILADVEQHFHVGRYKSPMPAVIDRAFRRA